MHTLMTIRRRGVALALIVALTGCVEYRIETTLREDGSGQRTELMVVNENRDRDIQLTPSQFRSLMNVGPDRGWSHSREVRDGDSVHVFRRQRRIAGAEGWSELSGDVLIDGTHDRLAGSGIGRVRYGDVRFRNSVELHVETDAGERSYTYRERFFWNGLLDAVVAHRVAVLERALDRHYPELDPGLRGEFVGMTRAGLWLAIDRGWLDSEDDAEAVVEAQVERLFAEARELLTARAPDADAAALVEAFRAALGEGGEVDDRFLREHLPGVDLAINTGIEFRLRMPGRVVSSNAHEREEGTLIWTFSPWDGARVPVDVYAESVVTETE